jgi:hypothetical protein
MAEMTKKEFLELLNEFSKKTLDPKFEQIDSRFVGFREDMVHQFHIISEDLISKVQLVAEGVATLNEKLDRHIDEAEENIKRLWPPSNSLMQNSTGG